ncbi:MAG: response regulator, partial [Huintestinicola sp.]
EVFSQENRSSRTKYEGTGLGLAIAKKLAERMGGTIEIQSKKGVGTTVIMTVPFGIGKADTYPSHMNCAEVSVKGLHALLAEDNERNREIAGFMLESMGICVEYACDGNEAVNKFESSEQGYYDIILMDIMMPGMNGWDAARMIRSMQRTDSAVIPIIAMSANSFADDIINSRISGMNEHLSKPLDEKVLLNTIKECIAARDSGL